MARALAHIEEVAWVRPIPAADNIELIGVLGWQLISKVGELKVGDKCVYIEIDSLCPKEDERFAFLESKKYKVKTMKLGAKLGSPISQGLAMPISLFPELEGKNVGDDVTDILKITYYSADDRQRKSNKVDPNAKYKSMAARHPKLAKKKWFRWLMKKKWGKKLLFFFLGKKKDKPKAFPDFIRKTDEIRVENIPWVLEDSEKKYEVTEKLDGTSTTIAVKRIKRNKFDEIVCSRNVRQLDMNQKAYSEFEGNVYWEMAIKYDVLNKLKEYANENNANLVVIQGECIGETVQQNPYKLEGRDLYVFNFIVDGKRFESHEAKSIIEKMGMKFVPIINFEKTLPATMEDMKAEAEGKSEINDKIKREGLVYREINNPENSFKNVSISYLLKHQG